MERMIPDLVRYAVAADLDVAALLLLLASQGEQARLSLRAEKEEPPIPEHHYPH